MRRWVKRTLFGLVGASVVFGGLAACSHHRDGAPWQMSAEDSAKFRGRMVDRVSSKLDLDATQKTKLTALADKLHEQRVAMVGQGTDPRAELRSFVAGDKFDRAKAQAFIGDKTAAINAKSPEVVAALGDFYDSLNPTQQQKVRDMMQRRHGWRS